MLDKRTTRVSHRMTERDRQLLEELARQDRRSMASVLSLAIEEYAKLRGILPSDDNQPSTGNRAPRS